MKKLIMTALVAMSLFGTAFAQGEEPEANPVLEKKHELRLDAAEALLVPTLEFNYEYVISKYSGAGAALSVNLSNDIDFEYGQKFAFTPFYRQYFLNKKEYGARGLFVEGMLQAAGGEYENYNYYEDYSDPNNPIFESNVTNEDWFNVGAGLAVGQKWVSNNGFVFELSAGG
ncbi:MAG: hypothetical protein ACI836_001371, partial [Saprospiraceae bacterium]